MRYGGASRSSSEQSLEMSVLRNKKSKGFMYPDSQETLDQINSLHLIRVSRRAPSAVISSFRDTVPVYLHLIRVSPRAPLAVIAAFGATVLVWYTSPREEGKNVLHFLLHLNEKNF